MRKEQARFQPQHLWNSRRYFPLIHAVVLSATTSSVALAAPKSAKMVAINKVTGKAVASAWLWRAEGTASGTGVIAEDAVVFVEDQQWLKSIDLRSGKVRWQVKLEWPVAFTPVAGEEIVLAYTHDRIWAYRLADGKRLWHASLSADGSEWALSEQVRPVIGDDMIFVCSGKRVAGMRAYSGEMQWMYEHTHIREKQTPVIDLDRIFVRTTNPSNPWMALTPTDGLFLERGGQQHDGPRPERPTLPSDAPSEYRMTISPDRRTLTVTKGRRSWKYRVAAPFTIAGVIGESEEAICIQIVESGAPTPRTRQAAAPAAK
jgi:hypothetical protein